jgi:hypothetical protein
LLDDCPCYVVRFAQYFRDYSAWSAWSNQLNLFTHLKFFSNVFPSIVFLCNSGNCLIRSQYPSQYCTSLLRKISHNSLIWRRQLIQIVTLSTIDYITVKKIFISFFYAKYYDARRIYYTYLKLDFIQLIHFCWRKFWIFFSFQFICFILKYSCYRFYGVLMWIWNNVNLESVKCEIWIKCLVGVAWWTFAIPNILNNLLNIINSHHNFFSSDYPC